MEWSIRNDLPIYSQLMEQIKLALVSGGFSPGERLPSVRDLAAEAGVNPNTMQRALQELEREGLVYTQRTAGRFVTEEVEKIAGVKRDLAARQVRDFLEAMEKLGFQGGELLALIRENMKEENNGGDT